MIRQATIDDLAAIMAIEHASFPTDAWSENLMSEELVSPHGEYVVVEREGEIIGYGGVRVPAGGHEGDIQTIALVPAARGTGLGRELLRHLMAIAERRGAWELFLEVRADNPVAHGLYVAEGFAELGRREHYYQPDDVDAIVMRKTFAQKENA